MRFLLLIFICTFLLASSKNIIVATKKIKDKITGVNFTAESRIFNDDNATINIENVENIMQEKQDVIVKYNQWVQFDDMHIPDEMPYHKLKNYKYNQPFCENNAFDTEEAMQHLLDERTIINRYGFPVPQYIQPVYHVYYVRNTVNNQEVAKRILISGLTEYFNQRKQRNLENENKKFVEHKINYEIEKMNKELY